MICVLSVHTIRICCIDCPHTKDCVLLLFKHFKEVKMSKYRCFMQLLCLILVQPLTGCFETLEREANEVSSELASPIEDVFTSEVDAINGLTLDNDSLDGLWISFNVETNIESSSEGVNSWTLLSIDLIDDVVSISNYGHCADDTPATYDYNVQSSLLTPGSFDVLTGNSFLYIPASDTVSAQIESANEISFSEYANSLEPSRQIVMRAFKLRDSYAAGLGAFVIDDFAYDVSCVAYKHVWNEEEDTLGNLVKVPVYTLQGSGIDELNFVFIDDSNAESESVTSVELTQGNSIDYAFNTESVDGSTDHVVLRIIGDLSYEASFDSDEGESGSLLIDLK